MGLEILYLLIPITFLLAVIALGLFVWAIHAGQFDDLETPAIRVLFDEGTPPAPEAGDAHPQGESPAQGPASGTAGDAPQASGPEPQQHTQPSQERAAGSEPEAPAPAEPFAKRTG